MRRLASMLSLLSLCTACASEPRQLTETGRSSIGDTLLARTQAVAEGGNRVDLQATFGETSSSPSFFVADNGSLFSRDSLLAAYKKGFAALRSQDIRIDEKHALVLSPDIGVVSAKGVFTSTDLKGKTSPATPFAWTFVWVRENGDWKWINGHQSFGAPARK